MNPKISIIVPVYNVELYIHKCIDSILAQTFQDFELILIDDGSPDNCGAICDDYAKKDKRIKVIHKENGGISSARNMGLNIALGEYIGFVDSDDWIDTDMYQILYENIVSNDCDIANCTSKIFYSNKTVITGTHPLIIHDKKEAMKAMLEGVLYDEVVWTKLFKRHLLKDIRFSEGIVYEDTAFTYKVIHKAEKVCCIGAPKYNYLKHENSTMDQAIKNIRIDKVFIYKEMLNFMEFHYPELTILVAQKLANCALVILNLIALNPKPYIYKKEYYEVAKILNTHYIKIIRTTEFPQKVKLLLTATRIHPIFYKILINIAERRRMAL